MSLIDSFINSFYKTRIGAYLQHEQKVILFIQIFLTTAN